MSDDCPTSVTDIREETARVKPRMVCNTSTEISHDSLLGGTKLKTACPFHRRGAALPQC
jgi:hypothetical protein